MARAGARAPTDPPRTTPVAMAAFSRLAMAALGVVPAASFSARLAGTRRLGRRTWSSLKSAAAAAPAAATTDDPHKWLEDVLGEKQLAWVEEQNKKTIAAIGDPTETSTYQRILSILDSKDKVAS